MSFIRWSLVCWVALSLYVVGTAHADDPLAKPKDAVAQQHLEEGNKLYRLREFDKAIEEYKAGALVEEAPVFLYNLGQCYRQLGKYQDAIWHYQRFESLAHPTGELKNAVDGFIQQMQAELNKKAMTQQPTEPAPEPPKPTTAPAPIAPVRQGPSDHVSPWYADSLGWSLAGAGVIAGATSGYLLLNANDLDNQANTEDRQQVRDELRQRASSRRTVGAIVGVGGVGLLAAGIVKLVLHPVPAERETASWHVAPTAGGVVVFGSF